MKTLKTKTFGSKNLPTARRKSVAVSQESWIKTEHLLPGKDIPFMVQPAMDGMNLVDWAKNNRTVVDDLFLKHKALLFRNFHPKNVEDFQEFVKATSDGGFLEYKDRSTPRKDVGDKIYTSTIHPSDQTINPHNEGTYWVKWALKLYFCCMTASEKGGETPIAEVGKVFKRLYADIKKQFLEKKMMLVRNYNDGFGLPWQEVYQTEDKKEVESYCRENLIEFEWKGGDRLRTRQIRPAVRKHPKTGELVWFNHAAFFHYTTLDDNISEALLAEFGEEGLPYNTYYGDGTPIEASVVEHIRQAYEQEKVMFLWQEGDILMLDNMSIAHAREPYVGDRLIATAMTEAFSGNVG